jgi:hypothetical protein
MKFLKKCKSGVWWDRRLEIAERLAPPVAARLLVLYRVQTPLPQQDRGI